MSAIHANQANSRQSTARVAGATILIIDDEPGTRIRLELALSILEEESDVTLLSAVRIDEALDILGSTPIQVVILDKHLKIENSETTENGIDAIPDMLRLQPHLQILVLTGSHDIPEVVRAMKFGACNYITKETPDELLIAQVDRAVHVAALKIEMERRERSDHSDPGTLGGNSRIFRQILIRGETVAVTDRPVLLLGETGTGKTELARWIHKKRASLLGQKDPPFLSVNVSTLSPNLILSELFGHEKGSFTNASQMKRGLFELAQDGTLFLDEIGEFPLDLQAKLLTVIEFGTFMRVGGSQILKSRPKVILATHRDLEKMVQEGQFREDLYMRISALPVAIPPLSERREDIPEIVRALLPKACKENRVQATFEDLPQDFIQSLKDRPTKGNIRGLQHYLEQLLVFAPKDKNGRPVFTRWRNLFEGLTGATQPTSENILATPLSYTELKKRPWSFIEGDFPGMNKMLEEIRWGLLNEAADKSENCRTAAKSLGFFESTFSMLLRQYPDVRKKFNLKGKRNVNKGILD